MKPVQFSHIDEVNSLTGFSYRTVYLNNEISILHFHDYYEIFLVLTSSIVHIINGTRTVLPRGTLAFIRKNDVHSFEHFTMKEPIIINITFTEETLSKLFDYLGGGFPSEMLLSQENAPSLKISDADIDWFMDQLKVLNSIISTDTDKLGYCCRILLMNLFTKFFSRIYTQSYLFKSNIPHWLYHLDYEMHKPENFSRDIHHMVKLSGKSCEYLSRMIKQHYGKTTTDYINDLRINYFANLLSNSDTPIIDICYECGFNNLSWAYSLFKKKYKVSPLKYRKSKIDPNSLLSALR